jgi:ribonuclease J
VLHKGNSTVHVSGHAPAGELLYVLNLVKPRNLLPVHGEWRHLRAHAALAQLTGIPRQRIVLADDGVVVDLVDGVAKVVGQLPCGYVYVDGLAVGDVGEESLKDRRILGEEGFITVTVVVDSACGKVVGGPELFARGFADDGDLFDDVRQRVSDALDDAAREGIADVPALRRLVRRVVGKWVSDTYRRRPMLVPVIVEV